MFSYDGLVVLVSPIYIADNDRRLVCHIRNADRNQTTFPKPILMRTNECQHLEDEKAENRHFRIGPLPQYACVTVTRLYRIDRNGTISSTSFTTIHIIASPSLALFTHPA
jgi:hypothetical protein